MGKDRGRSVHIAGPVTNSPISTGDVYGDVSYIYGPVTFVRALTSEKAGEIKHRSKEEVLENIRTYLDSVRNRIDHDKDVLSKNKKLKEYFVEQDGLFIAGDGSKVWTNEDSYFSSPSASEHPNYKSEITKIVENELIKQPEFFYLSLGASFGNGSSTLAKWLAYKYANAYSANNFDRDDHIAVSHHENESNCIPVVVSLRKGWALEGEIYGNKQLEDLLKEIIAPSLELKPATILLILDGIDQLDSQELIDLNNAIREKHKAHPTLKVLLLSKPVIFPTRASNLIGRFIRLLPFSPDQSRDYFRKAGGL